jgi:hypothetical protein
VIVPIVPTNFGAIFLMSEPTAALSPEEIILRPEPFGLTARDIRALLQNPDFQANSDRNSQMVTLEQCVLFFCEMLVVVELVAAQCHTFPLLPRILPLRTPSLPPSLQIISNPRCRLLDHKREVVASLVFVKSPEAGKDNCNLSTVLEKCA